jgi:hypothetical protein
MSDDTLVTRKQVRAMGLNVSSTQFRRYEEMKLLTPLKVGQFRSAIVYYRLGEVNALLKPRQAARAS